MTYDEARKSVMGRPRSEFGSFAYKFEDAVKNSTEDGIMHWMAVHFWEFPEADRSAVFQKIFDFANRSRQFRNLLISDYYQIERQHTGEKTLRKVFSEFDDAMGHLIKHLCPCTFRTSCG